MDVEIFGVVTAQAIAGHVLKACDTGEALIDVVVVSPDRRYLAKATTVRPRKGQMSRPTVVASLLGMALTTEEELTDFPPDWIARQPTVVGEAPALIGAMVVAAAILEDPADHGRNGEVPVLQTVGAVGVLGVPAAAARQAIHEALAHRGFSYHASATPQTASDEA